MSKNDYKLTREEERLEREIVEGKWVSDKSDVIDKMWSEAIAQYDELSRTKKMTMRVDAIDLIKVKARAKQYSMPYQTLLKIVVKQFAEGKITVEL